MSDNYLDSLRDHYDETASTEDRAVEAIVVDDDNPAAIFDVVGEFIYDIDEDELQRIYREDK